jgi:hypothetical protein
MTIDRGSLRDTSSAKAQNRQSGQIGHNVTIGRHCLLAPSGLAGSLTIGDNVALGCKVVSTTIFDRRRRSGHGNGAVRMIFSGRWGGRANTGGSGDRRDRTAGAWPRSKDEGATSGRLSDGSGTVNEPKRSRIAIRCR